MKCKGYKISGYDATYKKTTFNVIERSGDVLEITDLESGVSFLLDFEDAKTNRSSGAWRKESTKGHGVSITFGTKGWYQQLKYGGKKRKMRTKGEAE